MKYLFSYSIDGFGIGEDIIEFPCEEGELIRQYGSNLDHFLKMIMSAVIERKWTDLGRPVELIRGKYKILSYKKLY